MTICESCNQDMQTARGCIGTKIEYDDGVVMRQSLDHDMDVNGRCDDCNAQHGQPHHRGCDSERCPRCNGRLRSCLCPSRFEALPAKAVTHD